MIFADTSGCFQHLPASFLPKLAPPGRSAGGTPHHNVMGPGRESTWQYCEGGVTYILVHQVSSYNQTHGLKQSTQVLGSYGRPVFLEIRPPRRKGDRTCSTPPQTDKQVAFHKLKGPLCFSGTSPPARPTLERVSPGSPRHVAPKNLRSPAPWPLCTVHSHHVLRLGITPEARNLGIETSLMPLDISPTVPSLEWLTRSCKSNMYKHLVFSWQC